MPSGSGTPGKTGNQLRAYTPEGKIIAAHPQSRCDSYFSAKSRSPMARFSLKGEENHKIPNLVRIRFSKTTNEYY